MKKSFLLPVLLILIWSSQTFSQTAPPYIIADSKVPVRASVKEFNVNGYLNNGDTAWIIGSSGDAKYLLVEKGGLKGYVSTILIKKEQSSIAYIEALKNDIATRQQKELAEREAKKAELERNKVIHDSLNTLQAQLQSEKELERIQKFKKERKESLIKKYGKWAGERMAEGTIWIGMSETQLLETKGEPNKINVTQGSWGTHKQLIYADNQYIYVENGKVTAWQY